MKKAEGPNEMNSSGTTFLSSTNGDGSASSLTYNPASHTSPSTAPSRIRRRAIRLSLIVMLLSLVGGVAFLVYGMTQANASAAQSFETRATELVGLIQGTWHEYENAALATHNLCRRSRNTTRQEFRDFYEYVLAGGVEVEAVECSPNVTSQQEREAYEAESRQFYAQHYPEIDYQGVAGFVLPEGADEYIVVPSPPRDQYFIVHYVEPVLPNAPAIELDMYSHPPQKREIDAAVTTRQPVLSKRLHLVQESDETAYGVIIYHPGIYLESEPDDYPLDLSLVVVKMPKFLGRVAKVQEVNLAVYLFDTSPLNTDEGMPEFLGAGAFQATSGKDESHYLEVYDEIDYHTLQNQHHDRYYERTIPITPSGSWVVVVVPVDDTFDPVIAYVLFGGLMIIVAGLFVTAWVFMNARRDAALNEMRVSAEAEKMALIVKNAEEAAQNERELNDFLAHEVRNPLAAAISATCFITSALQEEPPLATEESRTTVRSDLGVIRSSLQYANDLLRNMLDFHKASSDQLKIHLRPTNLFRDIMEPVGTIIGQSDKHYEVQIECDKELAIKTDRIRLKQIVLNLTSNSCKFVEKGFVRIGAHLRPDDNTVEVFVEDSGPGIPADKRENLFEKFQSSLDVLNQGTGYGLSLVKTLAHLMGGEISLDESWESGIEGCPGARFVVRLNTSPLDLQEFALWEHAHGSAAGGEANGHLPELPKTFRILFVDDDMVLRKLFTRAVHRVAPDWDVQEASNGETAVRLVEDSDFDLLFVDQYMASIQKQMLGTETVRALRANGFKGLVVGLSANDKETEFLAAGANAFMFKPFPAEKMALRKELCRVLYPDVEG